MATASTDFTAKQKPYLNPPQPAEPPKKTSLAKGPNADVALADIPIRPMIWDGFVQQTGSADMDWAL